MIRARWVCRGSNRLMRAYSARSSRIRSKRRRLNTVAREIVINSAPYETRAALIEGRRTVEILHERRRDRGVSGNIYKGRIIRVLPGMQAAFVDIGLKKAAYLHESDLYYSALKDDVPGQGVAPLDLEVDPPMLRASRQTRRPIEEQLKSGQEILVQVAKPPVGTKGARVTSMISLPGRHLVFTPSSRRIGVSRRIEDENERRRLKGIVQDENASEGGFIIRTACADLTRREIQEDIRFLLKLWRKILQKSEGTTPCSLLHYDMDLVLRVIRDLFTVDTRRVLVDDPTDYQRIQDFLGAVMPRLVDRVQLYEDPQPIFERFGIEPQINKALDRKVWLKSGGYIVFDETEALTVIDVNTGHFVGKNNQEETVLRTNLEAVRTILEQLRLRSIGGLIVIDLIDMEHEASQSQVFDSLREILRHDKARSTLLPISALGLIEMTRKRTRASLSQLLCAPCPTCGSSDRIRSFETVAYEILRRLQREVRSNPSAEQIQIGAHPAVVDFLRANESAYLESLERAASTKIVLTPNKGAHTTEYEITISEAAA